jgi:hypothetical protein
MVSAKGEKAAARGGIWRIRSLHRIRACGASANRVSWRRRVFSAVLTLPSLLGRISYRDEPIPFGTDRMHVILATVDTDGDVFASIRLGAASHARGHWVTLATPETYRASADVGNRVLRDRHVAEIDQVLADPGFSLAERSSGSPVGKSDDPPPVRSARQSRRANR